MTVSYHDLSHRQQLNLRRLKSSEFKYSCLSQQNPALRSESSVNQQTSIHVFKYLPIACGMELPDTWRI